jgi:hypothetical protein
MAVLMLLVALLARVFGSATTAWRAGNKRIESNNTGRSAVEFMARELSGLLVSPSSPTISMRLQSDADNFLGMRSDRLTFVSLSHLAEFYYSPSSNSQTRYRDVHQIHYAVATNFNGGYSLYRWVTENWDADEFSSYETTNWVGGMNGQSPSSFNSAVLADNVRNFEVFVTPLGGLLPVANYTYTGNNPPAVIDIYLEVLAEDDARQVAAINATDEQVTRLTRRYATRIYVNNKDGYLD